MRYFGTTQMNFYNGSMGELIMYLVDLTTSPLNKGAFMLFLGQLMLSMGQNVPHKVNSPQGESPAELQPSTGGQKQEKSQNRGRGGDLAKFTRS